MTAHQLVHGVRILVLGVTACGLLSFSATGQSTTEPNRPPGAVVQVWNASPTLTDTNLLHFYVIAPLGEEALVTFDGRDSYDPEGGPLVFEWTEFDDGERLIGHTALTVSTFYGDDDSSVHRLKLLVVDQGDARDEVEFKLTVLAPTEIVSDLADYLTEPAPHYLAVRHRMARALRLAEAAFAHGKAGARRGSLKLRFFLHLARSHPAALGNAKNQAYVFGVTEELLQVVRGNRE